MFSKKYIKYIKNTFLICKEYNITTNYLPNSVPRLLSFYIFGIASYIFHRFIGYGYLPGIDDGLKSKISRFLISKILINVRVSLDNYNYKDFVIYLFEKDNNKVLKLFVPNKLVGSPQVFYTEPIYSLILKYKKNLKIIGIVHGGGYGIFQKYKYTYIEKTISDIYYGWGTLNKNIIESRYKKISKYSREPKTYIIGESFEEFEFDRYKFDREINNLQYQKAKEFIHECDKQFIYLRRANSSQVGFNDESLIKQVNKLGLKIKNNELGAEYLISKNDFIIFLKLESSLIYFCIKNKIRFNVVINPEIKKYLSKKGLVYYEQLNIGGFLIDRKINHNLNFDEIKNIYQSDLKISDVINEENI